MACGYNKNGLYVCDSGTNISGVNNVAGLNQLMNQNKPANTFTRQGEMLPYVPNTTGSNTGSNTNTGLFASLGNFIKKEPGNFMQGTGSLLQGIGGLYGAYAGKQYADDMSNYLDRQMGLYESEIDRRNKTRESYGSAFSGGA